MKKYLGLAVLLVALAGCGNTQEKKEADKEVSQSTETLVSSTDSSSDSAKDEDKKTETIEVTLSDDGKKFDTKTLDIKTDDILLDVMKEHFDITEDKGMVTAINGKEQQPKENKYWMYDVNGEYTEVGAAEYKVQPGDVISWKLGN